MSVRMCALSCAFAGLSSALGAPALGLDLPRELVMDVNKAPYPVVNIIADAPVAHASKAGALRGKHGSGDLSLSEERSLEQSALSKELDRQNSILRRLKKLGALSAPSRFAQTSITGLRSAERSREPSMGDVMEFASDAESLGDVYAKASAEMPSQREKHIMVAQENAKTLGQLAEEIAHERDNMVNAAPCPQCDRDYGISCPKSWGASKVGYCEAPTSYAGPCARSAYFNDMSVGEKLDFETRCLTCWPCRE